MILGHCVIYGSIYWPSGNFLGTSLFSFQFRSFSIAVVGCIPALASLLHYYNQKSNQRDNIKNSVSIFIFLFIIEGIKSVLISHRFVSFFHFDVLVLIGLGLLLIDLLKFLHRFIPIFFSIILFFVNPFFEYYRGHYVIHNMKNYYQNYDVISWSLFILFIVMTLAPITLRFFKTQKKLWVFLSILLVYAGHEMFILELKNPRLMYDFLNYPLAALIGIHHSSHVWPFLVWFPLLTFGHELGALLKKMEKHFILTIFLVVAALYYIYFYHTQIFIENFLPKMTTGKLGNESVFFINSLRLALHCSILILLVLMIKKIDSIWTISNTKLAGIVSRWIMAIYLMSIFLADTISPFLSRHFDFYNGFFILLVVSLSICFLGAFFLDIIFLRTKIRFKIEKVK